MMINKSIDENTAKLDQKMQEITHVQKRLLTRYKEKNPTAMNNLDILFFQIYEEIIGKIFVYYFCQKQILK